MIYLLMLAALAAVAWYLTPRRRASGIPFWGEAECRPCGLAFDIYAEDGLEPNAKIQCPSCQEKTAVIP